MASTSASGAPGPYNMDLATSLLIAQLALDDIEELNCSRKGKGRADAPLSDEQIALQIQADDLQAVLTVIGDTTYAHSINDALSTDYAYVRAIALMERGAAEDRQAALALSRGGELPPRTETQVFLESPRFSMPSEPASEEEDNADTVADGERSDISSVTLVASPRHAPKQVPRVQCVSCGDSVRATASIRASCAHDWCQHCVVALVEAMVRDESLFPLRCCKQAFAVDQVHPLLATALLAKFRAKSLEFDTPSLSRVYCPTPTCSEFLGSSEGSGRDIRCNKCRSAACPACREAAHPGEDCGENAALVMVRELAAKEKWQTCPGCKSIVELHTGCYHMTCRCRAQFCYLCAVPWKNCRCPQWEEARLLDTAARRVQNEVGARARVERPAMFAQRLRSMVSELAHNHDCTDHRWGRRNGGGQCEECHHHLRDFLLMCRNCRVLACVRCARNRL